MHPLPDFSGLRTPCYVVDERILRDNLAVLADVRERAGCRVLLAQKAFSMPAVYPLIGESLDGVTSSSLYEARLGHEEMGREGHVYAPAYREDEFDELLQYCGHIVFNSFAQWRKFRPAVERVGRHVSCGLRVNPGHSEVETALYDPCAPFSRLGVPFERFEPDALDGLEGLHFHALCEQGEDTLERVFAAFEERYGRYLPRMKWLNLGGGHHITRPGYDMEALIRLVRRIREQYGVTVYLEPGEAVALNAGYLVSTVLDVLENGMPLAVLDASAACHMPDVLEMPYRPPLLNAAQPGEKPYTYRLGGPTCLAGDVIGDYSFDAPLRPGSRVVFGDMAIYTMVKNNTFNGIGLPDIVLYDGEGFRIVRRFGYEDFKGRL